MKFLFVLILGSLSYADDNTDDPPVQNATEPSTASGGAMDLWKPQNMKNLDKLNEKKGESKIKVNVTCKDDNGKEVSSTDPSYQACMDKKVSRR